jgi:protein ImuB
MLDELTGRASGVRASFQPRARFRRRRELEYELSDQARLHEAFAPLFAELQGFLTARQYAVVQLSCRLLHRQAPPSCCELTLAAPCAHSAQLSELLREHLDALRLPEPVRACELRAAGLVKHVAASAGLWQPGEHGGSCAEASGNLIERLRARLGEDAVRGLAVRAGHRPENAWTFTAPPVAGVAGCTAQPRAGVRRRRPLWLLPTPEPLRVRDGLPRRGGPLRLMSEPERIESGWWDGADIARDYYRAVDIHNVRLWIFRERHAPHGWFLHGVFG